MKRNATVVRGGLAGVVAATALAVFFLVVDTVEGRPLYTPAFLASVLAGLGEVEIGFGLIAMYTALHYAVFILIGMGVVWLLHRTETGASYLLGIVLGFLLFDVIFYAGVLITGVDVVRELGWPELMSGNLIAGLVLMGYLRSSGLEPTVSWRTVLRQHRIIREGLIAGALGAGAVALWFLVLDVILGRIFFTPAALGSALFFGARRAADIQITGATVLGYTVVHVAAFLLTGFVAAALATEAERDPPLL
ncbi:MAG: hypothetical protein HY703_12660, partial [Gemmatimonadetes bacterium]|nr:hypothetical protein [Gemmatimonadota bacterium]